MTVRGEGCRRWFTQSLARVLRFGPLRRSYQVLDVVYMLRRICITVRCGQLIPHEGTHIVPRDALTLLVQVSKKALGIRVSLVGSKEKPLNCQDVILRAPSPHDTWTF